MKKQTQKLIKSVYNLVTKIKELLTDNFVDLAVYLGLPLVAFTYFDWRAAFATLVFVTIAVEVIDALPRKGDN